MVCFPLCPQCRVNRAWIGDLSVGGADELGQRDDRALALWDLGFAEAPRRSGRVGALKALGECACETHIVGFVRLCVVDDRFFVGVRMLIVRFVAFFGHWRQFNRRSG